MEKVASFFKTFTSIFYFKFLELRKLLFGLIKIWKNLNLFEPFKLSIGFKLS
jgi:hypothetical protein